MAHRSDLTVLSPSPLTLTPPPAVLALHVPVQVVGGRYQGVQGWLCYGNLESDGGIVYLLVGQGTELEVDPKHCQVMSHHPYVDQGGDTCRLTIGTTRRTG